VAAWGEFISWVQVHVLFKRISRGWSHKVEGAFGGEGENISRCNKCPPNIQNYFLRELQRIRERKKPKRKKGFIECKA
jgi:hypothetical protein